MRRILPDVFHHLTPAQQHQMLAHEWGLIAGDAMGPVLRQLVSEQATVPDDVRDVALVRLGEVAPREARDLSMQDIISGANRFSVTALQVGALPAGDIEMIASVLVARLRKEGHDVSRGRTFRSLGGRGALLLVERFGTLAMLDDVRAVSGSTAPLTCVAQTTLVAYALRVAPPMGSDMLQAQLAAEAPCREQLLDTLARTRPHLVPEDVAIAALDHVNARVASSAAGALALMGGEAGRRALWRRLERWHRDWKGRVADDMEEGLDRSLREALLRPVRWRPTIDERFKVRELCLTEPCRVEFSPFRRAPDPTTLPVTADESSGETVYHVDGVWVRSARAVAHRLSLYPEGTRAEWRPGAAHSAERARTLHQLLDGAAAAYGLTVSARANPARRPGSDSVQ